ncbi:hypothetical protein DPX16_9258 [Anabarilius grahami]|uniref:Uncharacterized protein n=1 Tax=Anabarilius grahami TaxID=495550 RepID=A0A3N0Y681_ANAGA|nr:hypothetical protein DPX16_9258 [Anabarilius grahami]
MLQICLEEDVCLNHTNARLKSPRCLPVNEEKRSALAAACNQMVIGLRSGGPSSTQPNWSSELSVLVRGWGLFCVCASQAEQASRVACVPTEAVCWLSVH